MEEQTEPKHEVEESVPDPENPVRKPSEDSDS
jgi:hypothetical protein